MNCSSMILLFHHLPLQQNHALVTSLLWYLPLSPQKATAYKMMSQGLGFAAAVSDKKHNHTTTAITQSAQ